LAHLKGDNVPIAYDRVKTHAIEAYIVDAVRTPIGKRNGSLSAVHPVDLFAGLLKESVKRSRIDPAAIQDVIAGCVTQVGEQGANIARNSILSAGFPEAVPGTTVDRQCGSSLQAVQFAAQGVQSGFYDLVIAGGIESMSREGIGTNISSDRNPITSDLERRYSLGGNWFSQAVGAESIANKYSITRDEMDEFSYRSHRLAAGSRDHFRQEIVPVRVRSQTDGSSDETIIENDEGPRANADLQRMKDLPPAFQGLKLITAGNSSQISDGASAAVIASEEGLDRNNLKAVARFVSFSVTGVDPVTMLTGPIPATKGALDRAGIGLEDIDIFEVNEAFAPVPLAWQREFEVNEQKVNPHGGAIAIGHPLGATGTRILATMINNLKSAGKKRGLIAICEGGGMANAAIVELT
jgi:acetyl-CoA acetyltransferase family protein